MKNRIISWITILTLMLTAIPQFGGVAAADMPISEVTLAYFGSGEIEGASVMDKGYPTKENVCTRAKLDTSVTYEDAGSSLMWQFGSHNGVLVKIPYNSAWESECDKFNIRFYSEIPGQTITMLVNEYDTFRSSDDNKYYNGLPTTGDGWQVMSVDISAIKNFWVVNEPEFVYVLLISGWSTTVGSAGDFEAGKVNAITGEKMYIDKIWLSNSKYGAPMASPVPSVENNSGFVSPELDGSNTFTFTYEKDIYAFDGAVKLYETVADADSGIEYVESDISYSVEVNQNKLNVVFDSPLPDNNYKIVVMRDKVVSLAGEMAENDTEINFSVGQESVLFNVSEISFKDGEVFDVAPSEISVTFGTEPDRSLYVPDYISLYRDGEKVYNAFEYESDEKTVRLIFETPLIPGSYTLKISDSYANIYGNVIMGNTEYNFEVASDAEPETAKSIMMFSAGDSDNISDAIANSSGAVSEFADVTNLYDKTAKLNTEAGAELIVKDKFNLSGMKYINYWIYNEKAASESIEFHLYKSFANGKSAKYPYALSQRGWNLISLPLVDFAGDTTYDALGIRANGENSYGYVLTDAIWASKELPEDIEFVSSSFPDGYSNASTIGEVLELTYSGVINDEILPVISVNDESGNRFTDFKVIADSDTVRIEFGYLEPGTKYAIKAERVASSNLTLAAEKVLSFSTSDNGAYLEDISFSRDAIKNESTNVTFLLSNSGAKECEITLCAIAAGSSYNPGALVTKKVNLPGNTVIHSETLTVIPNENTGAIKAYALLPSGKMLSQKYYTLDNSGVKSTSVSYDAGAESKINSASVNINVLEVALEASGKTDTATVTVENENGEVIFADVVTLGGNEIRKYFEFSESAPSGEYTVKAFCAGAQDEKKISYISSAHRKEFVDFANSKNMAEVKKFITNNSEALGLGNASSGFVEEISELICETGGFDVYADITGFIDDVSEGLDTANKAVWSEMTQLIDEKSFLFGGEDDADYKYYASLSGKNRNKISVEICKEMPVSSVTDLNRAFENAVDDYKDSLNNKNSGGSSGSSSKGSSGGSSVVSGLPYKAPEEHTPAQIVSEFSDLANVPWAVDSIMKLRSRGIVSASADKLFRPDDNIKREEFIKLIICAFAPDAAESDYSFSDCPDDAWFAPYVKKAYGLGILKGYPDGSFGAGENITREDMVTLIGRTLEALGLDIRSVNALGFTDAYAVSGYAEKYVAALTELGVINGMGDGSFAPKATATRAQSAKVIAGLIEKY